MNDPRLVPSAQVDTYGGKPKPGGKKDGRLPENNPAAGKAGGKKSPGTGKSKGKSKG